MIVKLLTSDVLMKAAVAARQCTDTTDMLTQQDAAADASLLKRCLNAGHLSIFEHINYTFSVQGVTRALLQELSRHRHMSLSVKSTRWALQKLTEEDVEDFGNDLFVRTLPHAKEVEQLLAATKENLKMLIRLRKSGVPNDTLKYFIPEWTQTGLIMTVNARELMHIFTLRTQPNVLEEFRELCLHLYKELDRELSGTHTFLYNDCADWDKLEEEFS